MATLREWVVRLWGTLRRRRADSDLEDELHLHVELAAEDARRRGRSPTKAARDAAIESGGIAQAMEALRDQRGLAWLDDLARDVRYGCRMLARSPGFTIVSVISLAIGIGANCAVFSFADALLLRPLTVPRAGEVLTVGSTSPSTLRSVLLASYRDYLDLKDRSTSFAGLVAFTQSVVGFAKEPGTVPRLTMGMLVSGNFFPVIGVEPELGRAFRPDEDQVAGRDTVVMLGHDFWEREFGADRSILGRTIRLNDSALTVIGVTPAAFTGLDQYIRYDFYAPLMMWQRLTTVPDSFPFGARDFRSLNIRGRLKPGVTMTAAQAELSIIALDLERAYILNVIVSLVFAMGTMGLALAIVGLYGLVAYAASRRTKEIGIRMAIGAGQSDVLRLVLGQGLVLAIAGLGVGLLASAGVARAMGTIFPSGVGADGRPDYMAFPLVALAVMVVTLLAAYVPARRAARVNPTDALRCD